MYYSKTLVIALVFLSSVLSWAGENTRTSVDDVKFSQLLNQGFAIAQGGKPLESLAYFDQIISAYEVAYGREQAKLYCARWPSESLLYLTEATNAQITAILISPNFAYAHFLKAYSLVDIGRISEAKESLGKAIALSPHNSQFLAELAYVYQGEKDWGKAEETFQAAEKAARDISPPDVKNQDLSRAWRGLGFIYTEQNKLNEAEHMYRRCLELNPNDSKALNELRYIQLQRDKALNVLLLPITEPKDIVEHIARNKTENQENKASLITKPQPVAVYLLPLDDFPYDYAAKLANILSDDLKINVRASLPMGTSGLVPFEGGNQYSADNIIEKAYLVGLRLLDKAENCILIALTTRDINDGSQQLRFLFSRHQKQNHTSVISVARMRFDMKTESVNAERVFLRIYKMTKRTIGDQYLELPRSSNIEDIMYAPIMSLSDIDALGIEFLTPSK